MVINYLGQEIRQESQAVELTSLDANSKSNLNIHPMKQITVAIGGNLMGCQRCRKSLLCSDRGNNDIKKLARNNM